MADVNQIIILAAGQGMRLGSLTHSTPKCLVKLAGRPLLEWQLDAIDRAGISNIHLVGGYCAEALYAYGLPITINADYAHTNMVHSLFCAQSQFSQAFIVAYADIVYGTAVLNSLMQCDADICVIVDLQWRDYWQLRFSDPLHDAESLRMNSNCDITHIGQKVSNLDDIQGQYIGLMLFRNTGVDVLHAAYQQLCEVAYQDTKHQPRSMYMTDLLQYIIDQGHSVKAVPIHGQWLEIDTPRDLALGEQLIKEGRITL